MNKERLALYRDVTVTAIGASLFAFVFTKYIFLAILPFLIAWGGAFLIRPLAYKLSEKVRLPKRITGVILTVLFVGALILLISVLSVYLVRLLMNFFSSLLENESFFEILKRIMNPIGGFFGEREGGRELEAHVSDAVRGMLDSLLSTLGSFISSFALSIPKVLIFVLATVTAAVYFSLELDTVNSFVTRHLPKRVVSGLVSFKKSFSFAILKYLRAYLIIMIMTFFIMLSGFLILGVKNAAIFALLVSFLDALPLLGVGTVLVPFSVYQLLVGNIKLGVGLIVLLLVNELVRQFAEPRVLGKNLGIHPIISLILLYIGYYFFGLMGLLLIPLATVVINALVNKNDAAKVG